MKRGRTAWWRRWWWGAGIIIGTSGCCSPGTIVASEVAPLAQRVADRHDAYVKGDNGLTQSQKDRYLRSTAILRTVFTRAMAKDDAKE